MEALGTSTTPAATTAPAAPAPAPVATPAAAPAAVPVPASDSMLEGDAPKPADAAPAADPAKPEAPAAAAPTVVDEKWEPKAVEGVTRDPKLFGEARALFAKHKFTTEQAQALVEFSDAQAKAGAEAQTKALEQTRSAARADWWKEIQADKELGGANLPESKQNFQRAVRSLGGEQLATELREMGLDNWPPLVRALAKAGKLMAEDTVRGTASDKGKPVGDPFERQLRAQYPSMYLSKES